MRQNLLSLLLSSAVGLPILAGAAFDLPRFWRVGNWTLLGAVAIGQLVVMAAALVLVRPPEFRTIIPLLPLGAMIAWALIGAMTGQRSPDEWPNALAYLLLFASTSAGAIAGARDRALTARTITRAVRVVDVLGLGIVAINFANFGFHGGRWLVHPRALALVALVPLCWHLARWLAGKSWDALFVAAWLSAIFVSLSRMASGAALLATVLTLLLRFASGRRAERRRFMTLAAVLLVGTALAVTTVDPFRDRLLKEDRSPIWRRVAASALQAPLLGHGMGSSQTGPVLRYWWTPPERRPPAQRYEYWEYWAPHPHNEYLRVWHDLGVPGLALFLLALGSWSFLLLRAMRTSRSIVAAHLNVLAASGFLMHVTFMVTMLTDNPLVYPFVIAPFGILIGAGLGVATRVGVVDRIST